MCLLPLRFCVLLTATCALCLASCGPAVDPATVPPAILGPQVFRDRCLQCHGATGQGLAGLYPPLANSPIVNGDPKHLALILLHGLEGPVSINGVTFDNQMPSWSVLHDAEIAAVLTYVRGKREWGNDAPAITMDQVTQIRSQYKDRTHAWTLDRLKFVK